MLPTTIFVVTPDTLQSQVQVSRNLLRASLHDIVLQTDHLGARFIQTIGIIVAVHKLNATTFQLHDRVSFPFLFLGSSSTTTSKCAISFDDFDRFRHQHGLVCSILLLHCFMVDQASYFAPLVLNIERLDVIKGQVTRLVIHCLVQVAHIVRFDGPFNVGLTAGSGGTSTLRLSESFLLRLGPFGLKNDWDAVIIDTSTTSVTKQSVLLIWKQNLRRRHRR